MSELDDYDYDLPRELIAQEPLATRSDARLMLVDRQTRQIEHFHVRDLPDILDSRDCLVLNNSRVVPARLVGYRSSTRGRWQGLFLRSDPATGVWEVLSKTRGKLQSGETLTVQDRQGRDGMELVVVSRTPDHNLLVKPRLPAGYAPPEGTKPPSSGQPEEWLALFGRVPLPPYIRDGQMVDADLEHYQTVYASRAGSVAAPTAGLHFTDALLGKIRDAGVGVAEVTLHVGVGTFRPIQADSLDAHQMHWEWGAIDAATSGMLSQRRAAGGRCLAVGTTSVRVLETAALSGDGQLGGWTGQTDLFIRPGHRFAAVDALMTNFHLPRSSLLVLVSAFAGRELALHAYQCGIEQEYRFYSYGDAMLIL